MARIRQKSINDITAQTLRIMNNPKYANRAKKIARRYIRNINKTKQAKQDWKASRNLSISTATRQGLTDRFLNRKYSAQTYAQASIAG